MRNIYAIVIPILFLISCNSGEKKVKDTHVNQTENTEEDYDYVFDLDQIKERGVLKALTVHSPSSYFLYKGKSMGFEYELLQNFADDIGVKFKVVKVNNLDDMIPMLKRGEGDIIAHGLTVTNERKENVTFTNYYNLTHQVLVQCKPHKWWQMRQDDIDKTLVKDVTDLIGETVSIRKESAYYERVKNLIQEIGDTIFIDFIDGSYSTEEIIKMVSDGDVKHTIADNNIADINKSYYSNLDISTQVSLSQRVAWSVRKDSPNLEDAVNKWLKGIKRSGYYNIMYTKYFKNRRQFKKRMKSDYSSLKTTGRISEYDDVVKKYSKKINWDWRLVSSIVYQESRFDHGAKSWVGAGGLMQIMPGTARELGMKNGSASENIRVGTKYLKQIYNRFDNISDSIQRVKLTIASYNCGYGHVIDAQRLAEMNKKDKNNWDNGVGESLLKLSNSKYYNLKGIKYGYVRGQEPYNYVNEIFDRYEIYSDLVD
ncbi:MAG: transporter substrate-binding domain-containing protein [Flavobacteriales bacterium]|nr:transporter substrate-binding domain-containing protein [Flavobacteriales bacterium]